MARKDIFNIDVDESGYPVNKDYLEANLLIRSSVVLMSLMHVIICVVLIYIKMNCMEILIENILVE